MASPGDTAPERAVIKLVVDELNDTWSDFIGVKMDLLGWETHTWPAAGTDPQSTINQQIPGDYDIFIGVLADRIGSPTPRAKSGTTEEFDRAYARHLETPGQPSIMIYFRESGTRDVSVEEFRSRIRAVGVYDWTYKDLRQFQQAVRIHLSRQIQQVARGAASTTLPFPDPKSLDIGGVTEKANLLLTNSVSASADYVSRNATLVDLARKLAEDMRETATRLNRQKRPGFRRRPNLERAAISELSGCMTSFASELELHTPSTMFAFQEMVTSVTSALQLIAPLFPLPALLRQVISEITPPVAGMENAMSSLRASIEGSRQAIAAWVKQDIQFNRSHRAVLKAFDVLDAEVTNGIHLTRELERTIDEFLEQEEF